jgi:nucleoside permease NupC
MTYAMCGFANFANLGLIVGSMGILATMMIGAIVQITM